MVAAGQLAGKQLVYCGYPITPAGGTHRSIHPQA